VPEPVRSRILEATYACVGRYGLGKTTIEDAAREAGMSRATVYRYFPGGRDQLIHEVVAWETGRFFLRLARHVAGTTGFAEMLGEGLRFAHAEIEAHEVLQRVLADEPERLLPILTVESFRIRELVAAFLVPYLEAEERLRPGLDPREAADYLARMVMSFIGAPGRWDLSDPEAVATLVRTEFLAGVLSA